MASSRSASSTSSRHRQRYRRSAFNGAKRMQAAGAKNRRVLALIGLLVLALLVALAVVVTHLPTPASSGALPGWNTKAVA